MASLNKIKTTIQKHGKELNDSRHLVQGLFGLGKKHKNNGTLGAARHLLTGMNPKTRKVVITRTIRSYLLPKEKTISNYILRGAKRLRR